MAAITSGGLRRYGPHVREYAASTELHSALISGRAGYRAGIRLLELQPQCKGLNLSSLLVNTVQRLPRYLLLLKEMQKQAPRGDENSAAKVADALQKVKSLMDAIDDGLDVEVCLCPTPSPAGRQRQASGGNKQSLFGRVRRDSESKLAADAPGALRSRTATEELAMAVGSAMSAGL